MEHLNQEVDHLLGASISPSSSRTYQSGLQSYTQFCVAVSLQPFPVTEDALLLYLAAVRRRLSYKTIKVYLAGIQFHSLLRGYSLELQNYSRLFYALRGIRRVQGTKFSRPQRAPITIHHLSRLLRYFKKNFSTLDRHMLSAAVLLAFFGLLRASEYTCVTKDRFDMEYGLQFKDVQFDKDLNFFQIRLAKSKTDPFRVGCWVKIWATGGKRCPVEFMKTFLQIHPRKTGPLFTFSDGTYLTRAYLSNLIQTVFPGVNLNTHSFRIGGASAAAAAGVPDSTIQVMGRWASNAYRVYLRMPDRTLRHANQLMSQKRDSIPRWSPNAMH